MTGPRKIKGLVIPSQWNETGRVVAVVIAAYDEVEYQVEETSAPGLMNCLHQLVEIEGVVSEIRTERPLIRADRFRVLDELPGGPVFPADGTESA